MIYAGVIDPRRQRLITYECARDSLKKSSNTTTQAAVNFRSTPLGSEDRQRRLGFVKDTATVFKHAQTLQIDPAQRDFLTAEQYRHVHVTSQRYLEAIAKHFSVGAEQDIKNIWKLCHIVYFPPYEGYPIAQSLAKWINEVDPPALVASIKAIMSAKFPQQHPNFWNTIFKCLVRGQLETAHRLFSILKSSGSLSAVAKSACDAMLNLLGSHPVQGLRDSRETFLKTWTVWRDECRQQSNSIARYVVNMPSDAVLKDFQTAFGVLEGSRHHVPEASDGWLDYVSAIALYTSPDLQAHHLSYAIQQAFEHEDRSRMTLLDFIYINFMTLDAVEGLKHCSSLDWWLAAHLADLLDKMSMIDEGTNRGDKTLREWFIINFFEFDLLPLHDLYWPYSMQYLAACPVAGQEMMRKTVPRLGDINDPALAELLKTCSTYGMFEEAKDICKSHARVSLDRGNYAQAIELYARCGEPRRIAFAAEALLDHLLRRRSTGDAAAQALQQAIEAMSQSSSKASIERLAYLLAYGNLEAAMARQDKRSSSAALVDLFNPLHCVKSRFWSVVLVDYQGVMESAADFFSTKDVTRFLGALEEVLEGPNAAEHKSYLESVRKERGDKEMQSAVKTLTSVRVTLAKCLATAATQMIAL